MFRYKFVYLARPGVRLGIVHIQTNYDDEFIASLFAREKARNREINSRGPCSIAKLELVRKKNTRLIQNRQTLPLGLPFRKSL